MSSKLNILLVEDYFVDEIAISRLLKKEHIEFDITRVDTREEYAGALIKGDWDLIICDYYLPDFTGLDALHIYSQYEFDIPFIIVSGQVGETTAVELMRCGAHDYIMKDNLLRLPQAIKREIREAKGRQSRHQAHTELLENHQINSAIFQALPDLIFLSDSSGKILKQISLGCEHTLLGQFAPDDQVFIATIFDSIERDILKHHIRRATQKQKVAQFTHKICLNRQDYTLEFRLSPINQETLIIVIRDVSEQKKIEEQLIFNAYHDSLTGLSNRKNLNERLQLSLNRLARSQQRSFGVVYLDFDQFKRINDTYGHDIGDELLVNIAHILLDLTRSTDLCARLGGDEFVLILDEISDISSLIEAAERILIAFQEPIHIREHALFSYPSVGLYLANTPQISISEVLRCADTAMYEAKNKGGNNYVLYNSRLNDRSPKELEIDQQIEKGLKENQFELYYQPIITLRDQKCIGFECLLRWNHPVHGIILPNDFLGVAEETDLIVKIDSWVIQRACYQWKKWQASKLWEVNPRLGINLSAKSLNNPNLCSYIQSTLSHQKINPQYLNFEVTEGLLIKNFENSEKIFQELQRLGSSISLDDFGTGYSALNYLPKLSVDYIKIDKSFTQKMCTDEKYFRIISTIVTLSHQLDLEVVVEGIEEDIQLSRLQELGCENGQGYLFSPPIPADKVIHYCNPSMTQSYL